MLLFLIGDKESEAQRSKGTCSGSWWQGPWGQGRREHRHAWLLPTAFAPGQASSLPSREITAKSDSHTCGRGGFVKSVSLSPGLPARRASHWLLLSAQSRAPQALAPCYHICLVEKWVGPKEQIYCVSSALGFIPASQNWSHDKDKCVWLWPQSLRIYLAPAVIKK